MITGRFEHLLFGDSAEFGHRLLKIYDLKSSWGERKILNLSNARENAIYTFASDDTEIKI